MKKTKIAVDVDDVLAKTMREFVFHINQRCDFEFEYENLKSFNLNKFESQTSLSLHDELINFIRGYLLEMSNYEKSKETLLSLKDNYELYVLTARKSEFMDDTKKWIKQLYGEDLFEEILCLEDTSFTCKSDVCWKNDFECLIDDAPHHAQNARDKGIKVLLFTQPWNQEINECEVLKRVENWDDIARLL